jgi:hypothetical protein
MPLPKSKADDARDPLAKVSVGQAAKVTGTQRGTGNFAQRTLRLDPAALEALDQLAVAEGITKADAARWIMARGLKAYYEDGERPETAQSVAREVVMPWSGE